MQQTEENSKQDTIMSLKEFVQHADYSFLNSLNSDPQAKQDGEDHYPREVLSGHYVPVTPTPINTPIYVAHSSTLFKELGVNEDLAQEEDFLRLFSGDMSVAQAPMKPYGWATGYALSIYGTEYTQQCPFRTGNGYGDGRAISIFEGQFLGKRWELQLKGSGRTPYCRGADGRAVLRSSVREFLAQELMHALNVPTSRSFTLYMSKTESVRRPWYRKDSSSFNPDIMTDNTVAISTRVAPSFLRVGQLELFARRVRNQAHPKAMNELEMIVKHLMERNYPEIDSTLQFNKQVVELAKLFRHRLINLVSHWLRVGYCQGNFNSDNCAAGGFTLDYGPFGFCELFDPRFQPWTGGGEHFSFFNQPAAAEANYGMFCSALRPLLEDEPAALEELHALKDHFADAMKLELDIMWAKKLGLPQPDPDLLRELLKLLIMTKVDYTVFFAELSNIPDDISSLKRSFYQENSELDELWSSWLHQWRDRILRSGDPVEISATMRAYNPNITWREWLVAQAYQQAELGKFELIHELQKVFQHPYAELPSELSSRYDRIKPRELFNKGGISHYSCSS